MTEQSKTIDDFNEIRILIANFGFYEVVPNFPFLKLFYGGAYTYVERF